MTAFRRRLGTIVTVNVQLLLASASGFSAWAMWPDDPKWWGFGVVSVICGMGAVAGLANALSAMTALYNKERALADYLAQGGSPKSAELASQKRLRDAGMLE